MTLTLDLFEPLADLDLDLAVPESEPELDPDLDLDLELDFESSLEWQEILDIQWWHMTQGSPSYLE